MKYTNRSNVPLPLFEAVKNRPYDRGDSVISVTQLIAPPRVYHLQERLADKLETDVEDVMDALDGSAMHAILEWAAKTLDQSEWVVEKRWFAEVEGWKISGQSDVIQRSKREMTDWKRCLHWVAMFGVKDEWEQQLNILRWLAHVNGEKVDKLKIFAWFKDWSRTELAKNKGRGYPEKKWQIMDIPVWPIDKAEAFVRERVKVHQQASVLPDDALPLCTPEERWQRSDGYAVMIDGEKRARALKDTKQEALSYMGSLDPALVAKARIDSRVGEPTRCTHYCPVRFHCDFGKKVAKRV